MSFGSFPGGSCCRRHPHRPPPKLPWWRRALNWLLRPFRRRYRVRFDSIQYPIIRAPFPTTSITDLIDVPLIIDPVDVQPVPGHECGH